MSLKFIHSAFLIFINILIFGFINKSGAEAKTKTNNKDYLNFALQTADWIISTAETNPQKISPDDFNDPSKISLNISEGVSGKILFFLELYKTVNDKKYLNEAVRNGEYLLKNIPENAEAADSIPFRHSFYNGFAGVSFVFDELYKTTKDEKYKNASVKIFNQLKEIADEQNNKISYSVFNDVLMGNTGIGLFYLNYYENKKDETALNAAEKIGNHLLDKAIKVDSGLTWKFNEERDFILPNFSHGAAGIGFFFSKLYEVTENKKYLETAIAAATYLKSIAKQDSNIFMIPYGFPLERWKDYYDIGWAHGPAGSARFFYNMWKVTGDYEYLKIVRNSAAAIQRSGLPGMPVGKEFGADPFYIDMRFGQASAANFFMDLSYFDNDESYLNFAKLLVDDLVTKSNLKDGKRFWKINRYAFFEKAGEPAQFTGYFYGAAGFGLTLLHLHKIINEKNDFLTLPDNPFKFDFETVTYKSEDSLLITADFYSTGNKNNPTIILLHRSASSRGQYRRIAPRLVKEGYNCLAVDTRWGGSKNPLRVVDNRTGERNGTYAVIDSYPQYRNKRKEWHEKTWPIIDDSYMDMKASLNWVKNNYNGKVFVLGSSITSIFTLKLASEMGNKISGAIAYSPGEYNDSDTTMVTRWASKIEQPVLIVSAATDAEEQMTTPIYKAIPSKDKSYFKAEKGNHGSIILLDDEKNWKPLLEFLKKYK